METTLNLKQLIINRKIGTYRIKLDNKEKFNDQLKKYTKEKLFDKYELTWFVMEEDDYISFTIMNNINDDL